MGSYIYSHAIPLSKHSMPITIEDLKEFIDKWDLENERLPLTGDFLDRLCQALQCTILDTQNSTETCLNRVSNVLVSSATLDDPRGSHLR